MKKVLLFLKDLYGPDINDWRWGESNTLQHASFSSPNILIPSFLRDITHEMPEADLHLILVGQKKMEEKRNLKQAALG